MTLWRWIRRYPLLTATVVAGAAALALAIGGWTSAASWLVIVFAGGSGVILLVDMVRDLLRGHLGIDILAITAIAATLAVGEYAAAMVVVLMLTGGDALEIYAGARAQRELTALVQRRPTRARRLVDGTVTDIPADEVVVGDVLVVRPNEILPVDGTLVDGTALIDESSVTGESLPVERGIGEEVLSGTVNGPSAIQIRATATAADSQYAQIIALVEQATASRSPLVRLADRYAVPFTLAAYVIAGVAWWASGDPTRFAAVLVVATPCPLLIAAPVAFIGGISRAARSGIIVKGGGALEVLSRIRTAALDKTGTITRGRPDVVDIRPAAGVTREELLTAAAAAEQLSTHVLAESVIHAARAADLALPTVLDGQEHATAGVSALVDHQRVRVGKASFVAETGAAAPEPDLLSGEMAVHVAIDDAYAGMLILSDPPRQEAAATVAALREVGVRTVMMITGDAEPTARAVAEAVGIDQVHAGCLPAEKVAIVQEAPDRPVMMVGDGVNDAPVLAVADVGVAMGARGASAAAESAEVVLLPDRIDVLADAVHIGRRTVRVALESIWLGIALSVVLMVVAAFGALPPLAGALSQEVVDLIAIGSALRALGAGRSGQDTPDRRDHRHTPDRRADVAEVSGSGG